MNYPKTTQMKLASKNNLISPLNRPLNRRPAQATQKPNSPRRKPNGDRLHINPQPKSIDTLRAAFKERNYLAIQAHSSELLLKLALEDCRFALQAHKELFRRMDFDKVLTIANHYCDIKTKDIFDGILSDWLEKKGHNDLKDVTQNLLFGDKIKDLFQALAIKKDLKTIAKILNLYERCKLAINNYTTNTWINFCRNFLSPNEIKALANLLDPIKEEHTQELMKALNTDRSFVTYKDCFFSINGELETIFPENSKKKILLIGGGKSPIKKELNNLGINISITNVDPIKYNNPEYTADETINEDFLTANVEDKFDEIWCLFSLPLYIVNPDDVTKFFTKALELLADNGVLRIHPLFVPDNPLIDKQCALSIKEKLLKPLVFEETRKIWMELANDHKYEVTPIVYGLLIRKKPQTT